MNTETSTREDNSFKELIGGELPSDLLSTAIEWIGNNLSPQQVFDEKALFEYASDNGEPDSVFKENILIDWARNYDPDGIFDKHTLESWAESNGYVKE